MKYQKPVLIPAAVPWSVATSAPHLKLHRNSEGKPIDITFIGFFKLNEGMLSPDDLGILIVEDPGDFHPCTHAEDAPYRMVRVSFDDGFSFRRTHAVSAHEVIPEADFDWREVPGSLRAGEDALENMFRTGSYWKATGQSPDPGFYEVVGSPWIPLLGINDPEIRHYIVLGQDEYFDIAARAWRWELGQKA